MAINTTAFNTPEVNASARAREIAFIDRTVSELDSLLSGLRPEVEAVVLSDSQPATAQIAAALQGHGKLDAIHIIAHGRHGEVSFGTNPLSLEPLDEHSDELASIGQALGERGRLLLWSCHTGEGERGEAFVNALARSTRVEVEAATGPIGFSGAPFDASMMQ